VLPAQLIYELTSFPLGLLGDGARVNDEKVGAAFRWDKSRTLKLLVKNLSLSLVHAASEAEAGKSQWHISIIQAMKLK